MTDLDEAEQKHVRVALRYLRVRVGSWRALGHALGFKPDTLERIGNARRGITASLAIRVARLVNVSIDDLLAGHFLPSACPRCGYVPDFADEPTVVEDGPRPAPGPALKLAK